MAVSSSSSSSSGGLVLPVWLYKPVTVTTGFFGNPIQRVALVEVPQPLPALISYLGNYYLWSDVHLVYLQATPAVVQASGRTDIYISHAANPIF